MKVDLSKLRIEMIDGSIMEYDLSKELAEVIFKTIKLFKFSVYLSIALQAVCQTWFH